MESSNKERVNHPPGGLSLSNGASFSLPSNFGSNYVVQTTTSKQHASHNTDLQKAIMDYQQKLNKQKSSKSKGNTHRMHGKPTGNDYHSTKFPSNTHKKLADTYMVGGCSMDLQNSHPSHSQRKPNMVAQASAVYTQKQQHHNGLGSAAGSKHGNSLRQRQSNAKSGGPTQLEPNPIFSIIDSKMDKLNKNAQEMQDQYAAAEPSSDSDINTIKMSHDKRDDMLIGTGEYMGHDGVSIAQKSLQLKSLQQRADSHTEEDNIIAYSNKRKVSKNQNGRTLGAKMSKSPNGIGDAQSNILANNALNDMTHAWSKYRRNINETSKSGGNGNQIAKASNNHGKSHSLSRQEYLVQQHKYSQQLQFQQLHDKVSQFQAKLATEKTDHDKFEPFHIRKQNEKYRFSRSIGRENYTHTRQSSNSIIDSANQSQSQNEAKNSTKKSQLNNNGSEIAITNYNKNRQNSSKLASREDGRFMETDGVINGQQQRPQNYNRQENNASATQGGKSNLLNKSSGKNSSLNGKVSTSLKTTWTVNRSTHGQNVSRLTNQSMTENREATLVQTSTELTQQVHNATVSAKSGDQQQRDSQLDRNRRNMTQLVQSESSFAKPTPTALKNSVGGGQGSTSKNASATIAESSQKAILQPTAPLSPKHQKQKSNQVRDASFGAQANQLDLSSARKKSQSGSSYQQILSSTNQQSQLANRRQFMKNGFGKPHVLTQAAKIGIIQEVVVSQVKLDTSMGHREPTSPLKNRQKDDRRRQSSNFDKLMSNTHANTRLAPSKQLSVSKPVKDEEVKNKESQPQTAAPKEFLYSDPGVKIGNGKFGPVNLIIHKNKLYALKTVAKNSIDKTKRIEHVKNEKAILHELRKSSRRDSEILTSANSSRQKGWRDETIDQQDNHPSSADATSGSLASKEPLDFIVMLLDTFVDDENINFVFEYLPGQDLYWVLQNESNLNLGTAGQRKDWVLFYCAEIICALDTLHSRQIIYRDMKPDNVMIDYDGHIKLIDFGFAKKLIERNNFRTKTNCGTIGYTAPEILLGLSSGYSFQVDIWSFGILIAELLSGSLPFAEKEDPMKLQEQIVAGHLKLNKEGIDMFARDFLTQIFVSDPERRPSIDKLRKHRFFMQEKPANYWAAIQSKSFQEVPYKPNPLKYSYLLQNSYPQLSNIVKQKPKPASNATTAADPTPTTLSDMVQKANNSQANSAQQSETRVASPAPNFGTISPSNRGVAESGQSAAPMKVSDRFVMPTRQERDMNVGLFGRGGGNFDAKGNVKRNAGVVFDQSPGHSAIGKKKGNSLLGDFTLYRVNKEFENF